MSLSNLPDVQFIDVNPEIILEDIIKNYEDAYFESTGKKVTLAAGDPIRIFLYTQALREIGLRHKINHAAKMNLLKYSSGHFLDHLGARNKKIRTPAQRASDRMKLSFSQAQNSVKIIPSGRRFSTGNNVFFSTVEDVELPIGKQTLEVNVICEEPGVIGNGFLPGQINVIVDPIPFLISAENIYGTQGGAEIEDDESFRNRIYNAPEGFSVAGPNDAYEYHTKSYNPSITDVFIDNPSDGVVDIRVLLENGEIPKTAFLEGLKSYFDKSKRPLTDKVETNAPTQVNYTADVTYYLSSSDTIPISERQKLIENAFNEFVLWQKSKIGRDINPSELIYRLRDAGALRVTVNSPIHISIGKTQVANLTSSSLLYGGLEDG